MSLIKKPIELEAGWCAATRRSGMCSGSIPPPLGELPPLQILLLFDFSGCLSRTAMKGGIEKIKDVLEDKEGASFSAPEYMKLYT